MNRGNSPLFVWKLVLIALIAGAIFISAINPIALNIARRHRELTQALKDKVKARNESADIIFFGNSLLQSALPSQEKDLFTLMARMSAENRLGAVQVMNLAGNGRSPSDLEQLRNEIFSLKPKIFVIQVEMIFPRFDRAQKSWIGLSRERLRLWSQFLRATLVVPVVPPDTSAQKNQELLSALSSQAQVDIGILQNHLDPELDNENLMLARALWSNQTLSIDSVYYKRSAEFIRKAQESGIQVLVLETPISETAARIATKRYFQKRAQAANQLLYGNSKFVRFPRTLPDDCFLDFSHLNSQGQMAFLRWLRSVLAREIMGTKTTAA